MPLIPTLLSRKPLTEPVKEFFIPVKALTGKEVTLRCWRDSISEPLQREILDKKIRVWVKNIQLQETDIESQFLSEKPNPEEWVLEGFLSILKSILQEEYRLLKDNLERKNPGYEMILFESDYPLILFLKLPSNFVERVLYNIDRIIPPRDREFVKEFLSRHNERDGVMLLKVIWDFE